MRGVTAYAEVGTGHVALHESVQSCTLPFVGSLNSVTVGLMRWWQTPCSIEQRCCVSRQLPACCVQLILLRPIQLAAPSNDRPLLVYLPGSDGTGASVTPQLSSLYAAGFDVRCSRGHSQRASCFDVRHSGGILNIAARTLAPECQDVPQTPGLFFLTDAYGRPKACKLGGHWQRAHM